MPRQCSSLSFLNASLRFCAVAAAFALSAGKLDAAEPAVMTPPPAIDSAGSTAGLQTVVLAGGCFWGVQGVFQHVEGVRQAVSGYAGGTKQDASYDIVSSGRTGHAEAVQVQFDPKKVSYGTILRIFFSVAHDPTQLNRQVPDTGTQYRSAIFFKDAEQKRVAEAYVKQLDTQNVFKRQIVTQIGPLDAFYPAEAYHQDYATLHPDQPYIAIHDLPKIENLSRVFFALYRSAPITVASRVAPKS